MVRLVPRSKRSRRAGPRIVATILATLAGCTAGPTPAPEPEPVPVPVPLPLPEPEPEPGLLCTGELEQIRAGTVGEFEDLSVTLDSYSSDGATIGVWGDGVSETFSLDIGEAGESGGIHLRLCGVWVDTSVTDDSPPGSDASEASYVISRGDSAPE